MRREIRKADPTINLGDVEVGLVKPTQSPPFPSRKSDRRPFAVAALSWRVYLHAILVAVMVIWMVSTTANNWSLPSSDVLLSLAGGAVFFFFWIITAHCIAEGDPWTYGIGCLVAFGDFCLGMVMISVAIPNAHASMFDKWSLGLVALAVLMTLASIVWVVSLLKRRCRLYFGLVNASAALSAGIGIGVLFLVGFFSHVFWLAFFINALGIEFS
jgi:hypothetical protein